MDCFNIILERDLKGLMVATDEIDVIDKYEKTPEWELISSTAEASLRMLQKYSLAKNPRVT